MRRRYRLLASVFALVLGTFAGAALLRGPLGWSPTNDEPVAQAILERLPATIGLLIIAFAVATALGAIIGFARARARAPLLRGALAVLQLAGRTVPILVFLVFLQLLLVMTVVLPPGGMAAIDGFHVADRLRHLIVPVLCLAVPFGVWSSLIFLEFFRTPARGVLWPIAMTAALIGPALMASSLFLEPTFAWPGVARLFYRGLADFDPSVVAACLLMYCVAIAVLGAFAAWASRTEDGMPARQTDRPRTASGALRANTALVAAVVVVVGAALAALAAEIIAPVGPYHIDQSHWQGYPLAPGVAGHPLGTDENGRDLLARVLTGLRTSLFIAVLATLIAAAIGLAVAKASTSMHPLRDRAAVSVVGIRAFAGFPFALAAVTALAMRFKGVAVVTPVVIALIIALVSWPTIVPAFRRFSAATIGALVDLVACALVLEMTQSALGFGVQPPTASLGNMFVNAQSTMTIAPWIAIVASVVAVVVLCALYAIGDELRERGRLASGGY